MMIRRQDTGTDFIFYKRRFSQQDPFAKWSGVKPLKELPPSTRFGFHHDLLSLGEGICERSVIPFLCSEGTEPSIPLSRFKRYDIYDLTNDYDVDLKENVLEERRRNIRYPEWDDGNEYHPALTDYWHLLWNSWKATLRGEYDTDYTDLACWIPGMEGVDLMHAFSVWKSFAISPCVIVDSFTEGKKCRGLGFSDALDSNVRTVDNFESEPGDLNPRKRLQFGVDVPLLIGRNPGLGKEILQTGMDEVLEANSSEAKYLFGNTSEDFNPAITGNVKSVAALEGNYWKGSLDDSAYDFDFIFNHLLKRKDPDYKKESESSAIEEAFNTARPNGNYLRWAEAVQSLAAGSFATGVVYKLKWKVRRFITEDEYTVHYINGTWNRNHTERTEDFVYERDFNFEWNVKVASEVNDNTNDGVQGAPSYGIRIRPLEDGYGWLQTPEDATEEERRRGICERTCKASGLSEHLDILKCGFTFQNQKVNICKLSELMDDSDAGHSLGAVVKVNERLQSIECIPGNGRWPRDDIQSAGYVREIGMATPVRFEDQFFDWSWNEDKGDFEKGYEIKDNTDSASGSENDMFRYETGLFGCRQGGGPGCYSQCLQTLVDKVTAGAKEFFAPVERQDVPTPEKEVSVTKATVIRGYDMEETDDYLTFVWKLDNQGMWELKPSECRIGGFSWKGAYWDEGKVDLVWCDNVPKEYLGHAEITPKFQGVNQYRSVFFPRKFLEDVFWDWKGVRFDEVKG